MVVNMRINDDLMERIDKYAKSKYMTRSALISLAAATYLDQVEALTYLKDVSVAIKRIADNNKIDAEAKQSLEDFEKFMNTINVKQL